MLHSTIMEVIESTKVLGVKLIKPKVFGDDRGFFLESYNEQAFNQAGITDKFVQDNHSLSKKNILRGMHFQKGNASQVKLVRVAKGTVLDVVVDLRKSSPTYMKWESAILSDKNNHQLYVPKGLAHGFIVISDSADFLYKVDCYRIAETERGMLWNDTDINIVWDTESAMNYDTEVDPKWSLNETPELSEKDKVTPTFRELEEKEELFS